jgi:hypothetical protein
MLIRVQFDSGALVLDVGRWKFTPDGKVDSDKVRAAEKTLRGYSWSPADGYPGYKLCRELAEKLGGKMTAPPPPPLPEGVVS